MKICTKCLTNKPISEFHTRLGLPTPACKSCRCAYQRTYRRTPAGREADRRGHFKYNHSEKGLARSRKAATKFRAAGKHLAHKHKLYWSDPDYYNMKRKALMYGTEFGVLLAVRERDKVCQMCEADERLEFDHIYPATLGGKGNFENLQLLCGGCNKFKSDNLLLPGGGMMIR